ncbi:MAG TPA: FprA family A-type flavoprotein [Bryobacteraceae bacterium]|jgi:flavorubredoxin
MQTRIDHITGGIYRISTWAPPYGITFNQFLIEDERPALIHTGEYSAYEAIRGAISKVLDPARLAYIALLHWEGDENGGMDRFMPAAPQAELIGSALSIQLNARGFGITDRVRGFQDGETLDLGRHKLRFLETPHVHHWDSMMVIEETTNSLFPSDLFIQPGDQPPVVSENLGDAMCAMYRAVGIFAHEDPVRNVVDRLEAFNPQWIHAMHGGTLTADSLPAYVRALRQQKFAFEGKLLGRELPQPIAAR